jgi:CheY-specific phosphatase CheX
MIQNLKNAIVTSISDVLETMFYMVTELDENVSQESFKIKNEDALVGCYLNFKGVFTGTFYVFIPEKELQSMAVDFMGMRPENLTASHASGTLKEVVNMIAGNSFGRYDDMLEFQLGIPEMIDKEDLQNQLGQTGREDYFIKLNTAESYMVVKVIIQ